MSHTFVASLTLLYLIQLCASWNSLSLDNNKAELVSTASTQNGIKLGDFKRQLLSIETICYGDCDSGCDGSCNESCDDNCNLNCNEGCEDDCDGSCDFFKWWCDSSCDDNCNTACEDGCTSGCDKECHSSCDEGCNEDCIDYYPICNNLDTLTVDWDTLLPVDDSNAGVDDAIMNDIKPSIQIIDGINTRFNSIVLNVTVEAEYKTIGTYKSYYDTLDPDLTFGFTYIVDTYEFNDNGRKYLSQCNLCENRLKSSYDSIAYENYWNFTYYPSDPSKLGNDKFLQYPNPSVWDLAIVDPYNDPCGKIRWEYVFTLYELINKCGFKWVDNKINNTIDLVGNFYLIGISPNMSDYNPLYDKGSYLIKTFLSQSVILPFTKASSLNDNGNDYSDHFSDLNSSSNLNQSLTPDPLFIVNYFGCSVVSVGLYVTESEDDESYVFSLVLLTYVPNWMKLDDASLFKTLLQPTRSTMVNNLYGIYDSLLIREISMNMTDRDCYILDTFRCWQKWQITFEINQTRLFATVANETNEEEDEDAGGNESNNDNNNRRFLLQNGTTENGNNPNNNNESSPDASPTKTNTTTTAATTTTTIITTETEDLANGLNDVVIDLSGNYTFQTQYSCTIDVSNDINSEYVRQLCENFTVSSYSYETNIITMDTQYLNFQVLSRYTNETGFSVVDTDTDEANNYNQSSLEFYYDEEFINPRNIKQDPFDINETVYVQTEFIDENIISFDVNGIYLCYGTFVSINSEEENDVQGWITSDEAGSSYCLEDDASIFEIFILFDILNDEQFATQVLESSSSSWNNSAGTMFEFSFILPNITSSIIDHIQVSETINDFWITVNGLIKLVNGQTLNINIHNHRRLVPSQAPTSIPTIFPSDIPTTQPTNIPSGNPTTNPTTNPSATPTISPSLNPSLNPSTNPSAIPSSDPSRNPSNIPTGMPTTVPTTVPTTFPTETPSTEPTEYPTVTPRTTTTRVVIGNTGIPNQQGGGNGNGNRAANVVMVIIIVVVVIICCVFCVVLFILNRRQKKKDEKEHGKYTHPEAELEQSSPCNDIVCETEMDEIVDKDNDDNHFKYNLRPNSSADIIIGQFGTNGGITPGVINLNDDNQNNNTYGGEHEDELVCASAGGNDVIAPAAMIDHDNDNDMMNTPIGGGVDINTNPIRIGASISIASTAAGVRPSNVSIISNESMSLMDSYIPNPFEQAMDDYENENDVKTNNNNENGSHFARKTSGVFENENSIIGEMDMTTAGMGLPVPLKDANGNSNSNENGDQDTSTSEIFIAPAAPNQENLLISSRPTKRNEEDRDGVVHGEVNETFGNHDPALDLLMDGL